MPGMPAFWAPSGPQSRRVAHARARQRTQKKQPKKSSPQASPEKQMQQNTVNSSVLWLGSRARTRARARRPENQREKSKDRSKSKTDRTTGQRSAQQFLAVFTAFCRARAQHRRHARQRLAPKCAKMSLAYTLKTVLFGWRGFLEGSLDDADQAPLKHHPQTLTMSATWPKPCIYAMFREGFHSQAKPQARAGDAEVPDLGRASRPSGEGRRRQAIAKDSRLPQGGVAGFTLLTHHRSRRQPQFAAICSKHGATCVRHVCGRKQAQKRVAKNIY